MSTNYYVHTSDGEEIHLGKYAGGWAFMFRGHPKRGVVDYATWRAQFDLGEIRTEAGTPITPAQLDETVTFARRKWGRFQSRTAYTNQHDDDCGNRFTDVEFC